MRRTTNWLALWVLATVFATTGWAAFTESTGAVNFTGNQLAEWNLDINFGSTAHSENLVLQISHSEQASGFRLEMYDITAASRATNTTEWDTAMPIWDAGAPPVTTAGVTYTLNASASGYDTLSLSGVHRIIFAISPSDPGNTLNNDIVLTVSSTGTATSSGAGFHNWTTRPVGGGFGSIGTASEFFQRNYNGNALMYTNIGNAADTVQYEFDVDFGSTPVQKAVSIYGFGFTASTGSGNVDVDVYSLGEGFQDPAKASISFGVGADDEATFTTAALSGQQKFRVVFSAGTGFSAIIETIAFFSVESGVTLSDALVSPVAETPRMALSPAGTSITASTTVTASGGSGSPSSYTWSITAQSGTGLSLTPGTTTAQVVVGGGVTNGETITVRATNGATGEWAEETYTYSGTGGGGGTVTVTATDATAGEPSDNGAWTINFSTATTASTVVNFTITGTATSPGDYALSASVGTLGATSITVPAATSSVVLTLTTANDTVAESTEDAVITLNSATQSYTVGSPSQATVVFTDDDGGPSLPLVTIASSGSPSETGPTNGTFTLTATPAPAAPIQVNVVFSGTATNTSDYTSTGVTGGQVTIGLTGTATVTITPVDDTVVDASETVILTISAGTGYTPGTQVSASLTIADNDAGPGPTPISGGGGGGGGCVAITEESPWLLLLMVLAMLGLAVRVRARKQ